MPRRNMNVPARRPRAYRPDAAEALARIDAKRARLDVSWAELAARVGLSDRALRSMRRDGRAFPRHVRALTFALRTIEREREAEDGALR